MRGRLSNLHDVCNGWHPLKMFIILHQTKMKLRTIDFHHFRFYLEKKNTLLVHPFRDNIAKWCVASIYKNKAKVKCFLSLIVGA